VSRARVVVGSLVLCVGACDQVWGLERTDVLPTCGTGTALITDDFTGPTACEPWGNPFTNNNNTVIEHDGVLEIVATTQLAAGCTSKGTFAFPRHGAFLRVSSVTTTDFAYSAFNLGDDDTLTEINGELKYESGDAVHMYGSVPYYAEEMRWWRLQTDGTTVTASYSPDAQTWTELQHRAATPTALTFALVAGLAAVRSPDGSSTKFDYTLLCD
jgi:hypothetical protein